MTIVGNQYLFYIIVTWSSFRTSRNLLTVICPDWYKLAEIMDRLTGLMQFSLQISGDIC